MDEDVAKLYLIQIKVLTSWSIESISIL